MAIYFISDLHLKETEQDITDLFFKFLYDYGQTAEAIYILGDFFDAWIGDDYHTPFIQSIKDALTALHTKNIPVFFMRGNRDFLIGQQFCTDTGCIAISDPYILSLDNTKILLTHGDLFITADHKYQYFRAFVQHPIIKFLFLQLPKKIRLAIANYLRRNSSKRYKKKLQKNPKAFSIDQNVITSYVTQYGVSNMIHGHFHLPDVHEFPIDRNIYRRFVLSGWGKQAKILQYATGKFEFLEIDTTKKINVI